MTQRKIYRRSFIKNKNWRLTIKILLSCFLFAILLAGAVFTYFAKDLPRPESFTERSFALPAKIYDRTGEILLYQIYGEEKRTVVSLDEIPTNLKLAVLAAEDSNFYHHIGIDFGGILRSFFKNIKTGTLTYGGSTLTQQLIRSTFLTTQKTASRKIKEIILTLELERRYSKDEIFEFYLNQIPFGSNAYGVEAAAQTYFNKSVSDISLEEAAFLASVIQSPSYLSPYGSHLDELLARKDNYTLNRMVILGFITEEEADDARNKTINLAGVKDPIKAPHFTLYIKEYLENNYSDYYLQTKGFKIYTTLDWELQKAAETAVEEGVAVNKNLNAHNAGLVAINPKNGEVLAMVGSADWYETDSYPIGCIPSKDCQFEPKLNIAIYGEGRQPGSAFKPFAYAAAFTEGLTPETVVWNVKTEFNPNCSATAEEEKDEFDEICYHPKNYTDKFTGPINLRNALAQSINVPAVKILYLAGLRETIELAKNMGITTLNQDPSWYGLSLVLGGGEVKLIDMVSAYGVFATEGYQISPVFITRIEDSAGNILEQNQKTPKKVLETQTARIINDILSDNEARSPVFGRYSPLYIPGHDVAVKTGTTQEYKDTWTIGYSTSIVAGVWTGNNDGSLPAQKPGVELAAPIWNSFMKKALEIYPGSNFIDPDPIQADKPILAGEINKEDPHSILHYIDRFDFLGETPKNPESNIQYTNWEEAIKKWVKENPLF